MKNGKWKGSVEILMALQEKNPPLQRTFVLKSGSGRYSNMLVVDPKAITAQNPTGMFVSPGLPMQTIKWKKLKEDLQLSAGLHSSNQPLIVTLVYRLNDPAGMAFDRVCAIVNLDIESSKNPDSAERVNSQSSASTLNNFQMLRIDVSEDSSIISDLHIKSLPTFVMFYGGRVSYAGPVGGRRVKAASRTNRAQV